MRNKAKFWYAAAWVPCAIIYAFTVASTGGDPTFAVAVSVISVGWAAIVSLAVWWLTGRYPWDERARLRFVARHLAFSVVYGIVLVLPDLVISTYRWNKSIVEILGAHFWSFATSVMSHGWLYGLVAGMSYTIRTHWRLRDREIAAARAEAEAARAQLVALRAQLSPHFLFNSLHSLSTLVRHDPALAEQALEHLGDMLRYALDDNAVEDVPLGDEWAFVQHYLGLEQLRLGERLRVVADLDPDALDAIVPCFTLQPLVENAIRHGIAPVPKGGSVRISAHLDGEHVVIAVADDGRGADPQAVKAADGHGLKALRRRLEARYGSDATLTIETASGRGLAATVTLPQKAAAYA